MKAHWFPTTLRWIARNWNASLAGISLALVALFALIPDGEQVLAFFVFVAANAVVWTLVEIKSLVKKQDDSLSEFASMRSARGAILEDVRRGARRSRSETPLHVALVGGRIRSMSDIVLEIADELSSGRMAGHVQLVLSCINPEYLTTRVLPGDASVDDQRSRNRESATAIRATVRDLIERGNVAKDSNSICTAVATYTSDPTHYAVLIDGVAVYWGPYTWSEKSSDWVGPENGCIRFDRTNGAYEVLKDWIENRSSLNRLEQPVSTGQSI